MSLNLGRRTKRELVWMGTHHCTHRHTFLQHPECYVKENPETQRTGFFDIETYGLTADFGIVLCFSIKPEGNHGIISDVITLKDIQAARAGDEDRRIVQSCIKALTQFDIIATHYGNNYRFDVPFVRTRAVAMGIDFPTYGTIKQYDTYPILKAKFRLSRNRQEQAVRTLIGKTEKNHIDGRVWRAAARGDKQALSYVLDHNQRDCRDLERLWHVIKDYSKRQDTSI